ncbi:hypothetical protein DERF_015032 [Dermatophagoides farinae]|uniref:Uncharacterized protein n=1 Tax=Dermatophagoides farinae TaxID=6954 RepID=A0A922HQ72_DERFA|nr:hypothetical protein DERF_015032 [Dermatophagoides farinae]
MDSSVLFSKDYDHHHHLPIIMDKIIKTSEKKGRCIQFFTHSKHILGKNVSVSTRVSITLSSSVKDGEKKNY